MKIWNVILLVLVAFTIFSCGGDDPPTFTVTFNANGGTPEPQTQTIEKGGKVTEPEAMTNGNYTFDGWYEEVTFSKWDFDNDTVSTDIKLYANWEISAYSIIIPIVKGDASISTADFYIAKDKLVEAIELYESWVSPENSLGVRFIAMAERDGFEIIIETGDAGPDADENKSMTIGVDYLLADENDTEAITIDILDKLDAEPNPFAD